MKAIRFLAALSNGSFQRDLQRGFRTSTSNLRKKKVSDNFSVDRSGLIGVNSEYDPASDESIHNAITPIPHNENKEDLTELALDMQSYIQMRGPISLHDFIVQGSNNLIHGYYQNDREKIGKEGDFITAPEMSPLFGEMIGMWCLSQWMSMGRPARLNLIEMGPGKGTLMKDILQVAELDPAFKAAINVHMVELSETMRKMQRSALQCPEPKKKVKTTDAAQEKAMEELLKNKEFVAEKVRPEEDEEDKDAREAVLRFSEAGKPVSLKSALGVPVSWHFLLKQVPEEQGVPSLVLGQEFLDAFPVHQFVYTQGHWREKLVDVDTTDDSVHHFRLVLSPSSTPAAKTLMRRFEGAGIVPTEGAGVEISPMALSTCEEISNRLCRSGGAALLVDYGENFPQPDSLRGFKNHKLVDFLSTPGDTDLTADVDFDSCARVAAQRGAVVVGAIPQGEFLVRMGIVNRVEQLIDLPTTSDEKAVDLLQSLRQLVDYKDMGTRFKVLAIHDPKKEANTIGFPPFP